MLPAVTLMSVYDTEPVPFLGFTAATWVKVAPLSMDRWTRNRASVVAVSCQVRFTCGAAFVPTILAVRPVGAVGALTPRAPLVEDTVMDE